MSIVTSLFNESQKMEEAETLEDKNHNAQM